MDRRVGEWWEEERGKKEVGERGKIIRGFKVDRGEKSKGHRTKLRENGNINGHANIEGKRNPDWRPWETGENNC